MAGDQAGGGTRPGGTAPAWLTLWKDGLAVTRDTLFLVLAALLVIFPATFNALLERAGIEEWSVAGMKWRAKLVDSDQSLKDANAMITDLRGQND